MSQLTLGTLLRHLIELLDGDVEALYRTQGLDYRPRFTPVVRILAEHGPVSIRQMQVRTSLSHSALSQTVSEMKKRGLVQLRSGEDARERIVALTPTAQAMLPLLERCWSATNASAAQLSQDIGLQLEPVLSAAIKSLEEKPFLDRIMANLQAPSSATPAEARL